MSFTDPANPYGSPQPGYVPPQPSTPPVAIPATKQHALEYLRSYNYIFENPEWTTTIMWGFLIFLLSGLVPGGGIIALLLFIGYLFEIFDSLLATQGTRYPTFDINRFGEYFSRGVWPFLAVMVCSLLMIPIFILMYALFLGGMFGGIAAVGEDNAPFVIAPMMLLMFVLVLVVTILLNLLMVPVMLRAGLAQDFVEGFRLDWIKDFIRKMWVEILLGGLFLSISSTLVSLLGLLLCCVGVYAAQTVVFLAYAHMAYQFYVIYITRGGTPVAVKQKARPPQMMPPPQPMR